MRIFVTGGAGYIGSHTVRQMLDAGHEILVYDNFSNGSPVALKRVAELTGHSFRIVEGDIGCAASLDTAMQGFAPDIVVHFAGLKAVGDSVAVPLEYYFQNVAGSITLLQAMDRAGCKRIVFSSSATVYGVAQYLPYDEEHPLVPTSPYGRTKQFIEEIICDWVTAHSDASAVLLRYFNPVGAHASGQIGEDSKGVPNNLLPYITQVAMGHLERLSVFGDDYETRDGTGERDYIHVEDLAAAHLAAVDYAENHVGCEAFNIGAGRGVTVLEMIRSFEQASGVVVPYSVVARRPGDIARMVSGVEKSARMLKWRTSHSFEEICSSTWNWQSRNSGGYEAD